jgi:hypothetical protein
MSTYHVTVQSEKRPDLTLYLVQVYRHGHDGPFTESFENRLAWTSLLGPRRQIENEKLRGRNRVHGRLSYTIIEEPEA